MKNILFVLSVLFFSHSALATNCDYENNPAAKPGDFAPRAESALWMRWTIYYKGPTGYESGLFFSLPDADPNTLVYADELGSTWASYSTDEYASKNASASCVAYEDIKFIAFESDFNISYNKKSGGSCTAKIRVWLFEDWTTPDSHYKWAEDAEVIENSCS